MAQDDSSNPTPAPQGPRALDAGRPPEVLGAMEQREVDPELVNLSRRRRRRHPLVSGLVIVLSVYLLYFVRADLLYFFQPRRPRDLGEVSVALAAGKLVPNQYVTIRGAPDRKHAILLQRQLSGWDSFVRLLQTDNRVYVQRHRRRRQIDREVVGFHSGRLVRFDTLPYREAVRAYLTRTIHPDHELSFDALAQAKAQGRRKLEDARGREVEIDDASEIWINVAYPDEWVVQLAKSVHPTADDARVRLQGVTLPYELADDDSKLFWRFVVLARGEALKALLIAFSDPARNAGVVRRQVSYTATWGALRVEGDQLVVDVEGANTPGPYRLVEGGRLEQQPARPLRLAKETVLHLSTTSRFKLPDDALVLVAGDRPDGYWHYLLLASVLGLFIMLNAWALARWRRSRAAA